MIKAITSGLIILLLSACGGGSGGGISGTGIMLEGDDVVVGTIEGFGSVIVNQQKLNTDNARITINGEPSNQTGLRIGMQVRINADLQSLTATSIDYVPLVVGPVRYINPNDRSISILGHIVKFTDETIYSDIDEASITVNTVLEVSGLIDANRQIIATYVRSAPAASQYQLLATVSSQQQGFDISADLIELELALEQLNLQLELLEELDALAVFSSRQAVITLAGNGGSSQSLAYLLPENRFVEGARVDVLQAVTSNPVNGVFTTDDFTITVPPGAAVTFRSGAIADVSDIQPNQVVRITGAFVDRDGSILADSVQILLTN
jgi:hypothetical protein